MINKDELITRVSKDTKFTKQDIKPVLNSIFDNIASAMKDGECVSIVNFGKFEIIHRAERTCKHPTTGDTILIPEMNVPHFKPSFTLKELVK